MITVSDFTNSRVDKNVLTLVSHVVVTCRGMSHSVSKEFSGDAKSSYQLYEQSRAWKAEIEQNLFEAMAKAME